MFQAMLESGAPGNGRKMWSFPLAGAIHFGVVGAALAASLVVVDSVSDPDLLITFSIPGIGGPPPPPAARGGGGAKPDRPAPKPKTPPEAVVQPQGVQELTEQERHPAAVAEAEGDEEVPGGDPNGVPGGVPNGVPGSPWGILGDGVGGTPTPVSNPESAPVFVSAEMEPPVLLRKVEPEYPPAARAARVSGRVVLQAVISETGAVESVRILRSESVLLEDAAVRAVERWQYKPAFSGKQPVRVYFTIIVTFKLE